MVATSLGLELLRLFEETTGTVELRLCLVKGVPKTGGNLGKRRF
jgi:hypothetical protein